MLRFFLALMICLVDQLSKEWALGETVPYAVTSFLNIVLAFNKGMSFGLAPQISPWLWILIALLIILLLFYMGNDMKTTLSRWGVPLIIGGALGNVIDRLIYGAVVDFIDVHWMGYHFPAFNIADASITLGAIAILMDQLFLTQKDKHHA